MSAVECVVIGSGPGGSLTAAVLAQGGKEVVVLEEGPPAASTASPPFSLQEMALRYRDGGITPAFGRPKIAYAEACCEGGGSEINSGLYHRTPASILEFWREAFGLKEASEKDLMPHFLAVEKDLSVTLSQTPPPPASVKMACGAAAFGWRCMEIPRWMRWSDGKGERQTMSRTYLPQARLAGARVETGLRATRLRRGTGEIWEIEARDAAGRCAKKTIKAKSVFVCAGATQTPLLLQRSDLGFKTSTTLRCHPTVKVIARFDEDVNSEDMGVPVHQVKEFSPRISMGCSISSPPFLAMGLAEFPEWLLRLKREWRKMAVYYAMIVPEGRGSVTALPFMPGPLVRFKLADSDLMALSQGLTRLCQLLFAAGATHLFPSVSGLGPFHRPEDLSAIPEVLPRDNTQLMTIHLFSSVPMGENGACCVTDSFGRVRGFQRLFVNDASLLPSAPGVNPQGSVLAFARRNALAALETLK